MKKRKPIFLTLFCIGLFINLLLISETTFFSNKYADKMRALRKGEAITIEPGLFGRLNHKNKTLELSSGRVLNVANDHSYFPTSDAERKAIEKEESFQSNHPITYKTQKFFKDNGFDFLLISGCIFAVYICWQILKLIIRGLFFTATKAVKDAKRNN